MSLEKAIKHGKEHRKPYRQGCRGLHFCDYCLGKVKYKDDKLKHHAVESLKDANLSVSDLEKKFK